MGSLNNKVAVITGGTRGLGLAIAQAYAREGAAVVIASRSIRSVDQIETAIDAPGAALIAASGTGIIGLNDPR